MTTKGNQVQEEIRRVAIRIGKRKRWAKGWFAFDKLKYAIPANDVNAVCWCMWGALTKERAGSDSIRAIARLVPDGEIAKFNDNPATTHADVMRVLRKAFIAAGKERR